MPTSATGSKSSPRSRPRAIATATGLARRARIGIMRVDVIDSTQALADLRPNWDAVYDADPDAQFFLSWTWMSRWLPAIGTPWFVLAARPDDNAPYVAFLPLWLQTKEQASGGFRNNLIMGGSFISDYTGILCRAE